LSVALLLSVHAALFLSHAVAHVEFVGLTLPTWPVLLLPFLAAWFWGIPQAYNLIDGINGLSMGFGLLALGILGWHLPTQPALMWGGLSAVLLLNFPRAKHFLGDCGALMLGTLFAALAVNLLVARNADLPVWLFAYPIVDVTLVVAIRRWRRQPLGSADRSHLHHWMMDRVGQRSWLATPILLTLAVLPMLRLVDGTGMRALSLIGAVALGGLALKAFLDRILPDPTSIPVAQVRREIPLMPRSETSETSRVQPIP
ncbi:MAG TPA: MraY family glycosyltransferase, partial [Holophagaceae bacterium]